MKSGAPSAGRVREVLGWLEAEADPGVRQGLVRYGIETPKALGVPMNKIQKIAKQAGRDHELALALWETGWYEARLLTAYVDDPALVTSAQMDRWANDFDNWGVCDTLCFSLFDRAPHAWKKVEPWSLRPEEFVRRAGFALLACLALHDKETADGPFLEALALIEAGAGDERNFVKKGVLWALRGIATRNAALKAAALDLARRLAERGEPSARWIGKTALREIKKPAKAGKAARKP